MWQAIQGSDRDKNVQRVPRRYCTIKQDVTDETESIWFLLYWKRFTCSHSISSALNEFIKTHRIANILTKRHVNIDVHIGVFQRQIAFFTWNEVPFKGSIITKTAFLWEKFEKSISTTINDVSLQFLSNVESNITDKKKKIHEFLSFFQFCFPIIFLKICWCAFFPFYCNCFVRILFVWISNYLI